MIQAPDRFFSPQSIRHCSVFFAVLLTAMVIVLSSCGKKGPPMPQTFVEPPIVTGVQVILENNSATLRWPIPDWEEKGKDFIAGFYVYRSQEAFAEKTCADCPVRFKKVAEIQNKNNTSAGSYSELLETGFQYYFKISVYTDNGYEGEKSEAVGIKF
jgi:hypothetical protein